MCQSTQLYSVCPDCKQRWRTETQFHGKPCVYVSIMRSKGELLSRNKCPDTALDAVQMRDARQPEAQCKSCVEKQAAAQRRVDDAGRTAAAQERKVMRTAPKYASRIVGDPSGQREGRENKERTEQKKKMGGGRKYSNHDALQKDYVWI